MEETRELKLFLRKVLIALFAFMGVTLLGIIFILILFFKFNFGAVFSSLSSRFYTPAEIQSIKDAAYDSAANDITDNVEHLLSSGYGANYAIRNLFPNKLVYSSNGRYYFQDIDRSLKANMLDNSKFRVQGDGEITYEGDTPAYKGIDISRYQGSIDFAAVKNSGVDYTMIRCGYRGYGSGQLAADPMFESHINAALSNDMPVGVYFFSQAVTTQEAVEEADYVIDMISKYDITYPVAIDVEEVTEDYRQQNLSASEMTDIVIAFCERIKEAGYTPMIYANLPFIGGRLEMNRLEEYDKWYAYYAEAPYMPYEFTMWQYTSSGTVDGVDGSVDMNLSFKDYAAK